MSVPKQDRVRMSASIEAYAQRVASEMPPLTPAQLDALSAIFHRGRQGSRTPPPEPKVRPTQIYRHFDKCGCLLYVGISYDAVKRNYAHAGNSWWTKWVDRIGIHEETYDGRAEAQDAEREFIRSEEPVFNTVHALDKRTAIIRYLIKHEHWEHLSVAAALERRDKIDLLRQLERASLFDGVMYHEEPVALTVDWQDPVVRRFIVKTETDANDCWRWRGHVGPNGYGTFRHEATKLAHRAAYLLFRGSIPAGHDIRHRCGVKDCVNPQHLRAVVEDGPRRTVDSILAVCEKNHPGQSSRWAKRSTGRPYCRECNRVRAKARRSLPTNDS